MKTKTELSRRMEYQENFSIWIKNSNLDKLR